MLGIKTVLVSGVLMAGAYIQINPLLINMSQSNHILRGPASFKQQQTNTKSNTTHYKNGQIKEEVMFNDGNFKIFRTFDENGKQIFNQDVEIDCADSK